jgi:hypothetical protein
MSINRTERIIMDERRDFEFPGDIVGPVIKSTTQNGARTMTTDEQEEWTITCQVDDSGTEKVFEYATESAQRFAVPRLLSRGYVIMSFGRPS